MTTQSIENEDTRKNLPPNTKLVEPRAPAAHPLALRIRRFIASAPLLRAVREIAIVTLGILIAFALNTWWEGRKELRQEQQHLRALASDFERNIEMLQRDSEREERIAKSSIELLRVARGIEDVPPEQIRVLMGRVFSSTRFQPVMGAYEAVVNSSGLTIVHNDKLRASLANYAAAVTGRYGERLGDEMYLAFIHEFAGRLQIATEVTGATPSTKQYVDLLADPKFQEYLALRNLAEGQMGDLYRDLLSESKDILSMLRQEIKH